MPHARVWGLGATEWNAGASSRFAEPLAASAILGLEHGVVRLAPPDARWLVAGAAECERLRGVLGAECVGAEHVGSTAVAGLAAKPILDLAVATGNALDRPELDARLAAAQYHFVLDGGHEGGLLFTRSTGDTVFVHLHVVRADDPQWRAYLAFRDALAQSGELRAQYATLKSELATRYRDDRQAYTDAKSAFIRQVLDSH